MSTPHGPLRIQVPRCRQGGVDTTLVFDCYQRRIQDVDRILRHVYLLGASTRGLAQLVEQIFGGSVSHQTISRLMRWLGLGWPGWLLQQLRLKLRRAD